MAKKNPKNQIENVVKMSVRDTLRGLKKAVGQVHDAMTDVKRVLIKQKEANAKFDKEKFLAQANKIAAQQKMNEKYGKPRQKVDPQEMVRVAAEIEAERAARRPPQWTGAQTNAQETKREVVIGRDRNKVSPSSIEAAVVSWMSQEDEAELNAALQEMEKMSAELAELLGKPPAPPTAAMTVSAQNSQKVDDLLLEIEEDRKEAEFISKFQSIQAMLMQSMNPTGNSAFQKWAPTSQHADQLSNFSKELSDALDKIKPKGNTGQFNAVTEIFYAIKNMDVGHGESINRYFESHPQIKKLFKDNVDLLLLVNHEFVQKVGPKAAGIEAGKGPRLITELGAPPQMLGTASRTRDLGLPPASPPPAPPTQQKVHKDKGPRTTTGGFLPASQQKKLDADKAARKAEIESIPKGIVQANKERLNKKGPGK